MTTCRVCATPISLALYTSPREQCVTTMCQVLPHRIDVHFCSHCGHLQTNPLGDLTTYYNDSYRILADSEDEDQLYAFAPDGRKIFRTEHQVSTLFNKATVPAHARVLDYGCAKASTLREMLKTRPDIVPHCFDVSDLYQPFWNQFVPAANCSTHQLKPEWHESFDLVTSFFALEHVEEPRAFAETVASLIKPGGYFYCLVPNVYANSGDFIVADHVSHFSRTSLHELLANAGLLPLSIEDDAHAAAWVVVAHKAATAAPNLTRASEVASLATKCATMAAYWQNFGDAVQAFERDHAKASHIAIYGSGFYGTCIASSLEHPEKIACFLDQNPFRQKQTLLGNAILAPEALPESVQLVYIGLNPAHARKTIQGMNLWAGRDLDCFYP
jgi:2-polyprenyl-3-methyl-5-hydroxy-6-metoxy-1,4-benzoquinol methylase